MDKKTKKKILNTIVDIIGVGTMEFGFDGLFKTQPIDHSLTRDELDLLLENKPSWTAYQFYEYALLPLVSRNPTKHQSLRWIYSTLANSCTDDVMKRNYFEKSFKEMILSKIDNVSNVDYIGEFYAIVLTRDSCCMQCSHYSENDIYAIDTILKDLPPLIRNCEHEQSCHATISVMTENRYNALKKRGR